MKTTLILIFLLVSYGIFAQNVPTNDPGYSLHNYKHVNKAMTIAKRDTNKGIGVSPEEIHRDYKKSASKNRENTLIIIREGKKEDYLKRVNYKMPKG